MHYSNWQEEKTEFRARSNITLIYPRGRQSGSRRSAQGLSDWTSTNGRPMSGFTSKADLISHGPDFSKVPKAAVSNRSNADNLFDHVVGAGEQGQRDFEAERFGGLEIDGSAPAAGPGNTSALRGTVMVQRSPVLSKAISALPSSCSDRTARSMNSIPKPRCAEVAGAGPSLLTQRSSSCRGASRCLGSQLTRSRPSAAESAPY